MKISLLLLMEM